MYEKFITLLENQWGKRWVKSFKVDSLNAYTDLVY